LWIGTAQHHVFDSPQCVGVLDDLAAVAMHEDLFFEGSLREALEFLSRGRGIPLDGDPTSGFNEFSGSVPDIDGDGDIELAGGAADADRDCFAGETTHCVGFEWWLPLDHANQIQTDSVEFDLGFYAEQCRHNDGGGQAAENGDDSDGGAGTIS
jgi:hypothetical protein